MAGCSSSNFGTFAEPFYSPFARTRNLYVVIHVDLRRAKFYCLL